MKDNVVDISTIVDKLKLAGIVKEVSWGMTGEFSIENHNHLLTAEELEKFLFVLHLASPDHDKECTDLHSFNFKYFED